MSDTNEREEFKKWWEVTALPYTVTADRDYIIWQAAASASDARYQARVRELEEALSDLVDVAKPAMESANADGASYEVDEELAVALALLSTTTPDTALQKALLKAQANKLEHLADHEKMYDKRDFLRDEAKELRAQLATLG